MFCEFKNQQKKPTKTPKNKTDAGEGVTKKLSMPKNVFSCELKI